MKLLGVDAETTGLDITEDRIIEIGTVNYDTENWTQYHSFSSLLWDESYKNPKEEALAVNKIPIETLKRYGYNPKEVWECVAKKIEYCDAVFGHNIINFDIPFIKSEANKYGVEIPEKIYIDTRFDIKYSKNSTSKRLTHLAVDNDIPVVNAHRVLGDINLCYELIKRNDFQKIIESAKTPLIKVECYPPYGQNQQARDNRYTWDPLKKSWWKFIRESDFELEVKCLSFPLYKSK